MSLYEGFRKMRKEKSHLKTASLIACATMAMALIVAGCGGNTTSGPVSSSAPSFNLKATSSTSGGNDYQPRVRANGRDLVSFEATVKGLSSNVGFFIPTNFGAFLGGTVGTDGFTYFTADRNGIARATMIAGTLAGESRVQARSMYKDAIIPINFDIGTMTVLPSTVFLPAIKGTCVTLRAFGALPPVSWSVSNPRTLELKDVDDYTKKVCVRSESFVFVDQNLFVYVIDREGTEDSVAVTIDFLDPTSFTGTGCVNGSVTVSPSSALSGATVSVLIDDQDMGLGPVDVSVNYSDGQPSETISLSVWQGVAGVFQTNYQINCATGDCTPAGGAATTIDFSYADRGSNCVTTYIRTATVTGL